MPCTCNAMRSRYPSTTRATPVAPQGLGRLGQPIEGAPLGVQRTFRRIEVLGLALADDAPPEGDDPALPVEDGEHDAVAEAVIKAAPVPGHQQPHFLGQFQGDAPVLEVPPSASHSSTA